MNIDNPDNQPERAVPGTDYRSPAPFAATVSRRRFLQVGGVLAGAAAAGAGASQFAGLTGRSRAAAATGTIADLKHVVILMQENRSFDHYFGTLRGVRGFSDKQLLKYQNGTTIFDQPDKSRTDLGYLLPFHMDSAKVDAQNAGDLDHSWAGDHSARNNGLWNNWAAAKTQQTMGYFTRNDLPFNYALADAFTICDGYHQSMVPRGLDRCPGPQRHRLAAVGDRRSDRGVRLRQPGLLRPGTAGQGTADHPVRYGEVLPGRRAARRGRAGDAGPGAGHPAAPAEPAYAARRRHH
jgi:Phosphoesterase family